jgi:methylated-DNA-[protein]-cysteine S-methyltransferase
VSECAVLDTPVGRLVLTAGAGAVRRVRWRDGAELQIPDDGSLLQQAVRELEEYFAGRRRHFKVPVDLGPLDASTRRVLATLQQVPYGRSVTYGELAELSGTGLPARAVGSVMGANPVPLLIGCHRVLAGEGLGGFSGGPPGQEMETKRWLLEHEGILQPRLI